MDPTCDTPNTVNLYFAGIVRCPHCPFAGGWLVLLGAKGEAFFSILKADVNGEREIGEIIALVRANPAEAARQASLMCLTKIDKVEWLETLEDGKWVQAANLFAHRTKEKNMKAAAPLN